MRSNSRVSRPLGRSLTVRTLDVGAAVAKLWPVRWRALAKRKILRSEMKLPERPIVARGQTYPVQ